MTVAEIVQIVIGALSLAATVAVSFLIYWLQHRHEKDIERIEEKRKQTELTEEAHRFLIDNADEEEYLPWCVIAANQHRHAHHVRKIYTNFCRCSEELQNKVLEIAGFTLRTIDGTDWVDEGFEKLEADIEKYHLGEQPFLYDGAKHFHRSFEDYRDTEYKGQDNRIFKTIYKQSPLCFWHKNEAGKVSLSSYVEQYFDYVLDTERTLSGLEWENPVPPVDYIWEDNELCNFDSDFVCFWVMELVGNFTINIHNRVDTIDKNNMLRSNSTYARAKTYEDRYYQILEWLYFTYCYKDSEAKKTKRIKLKKTTVKTTKSKKCKKKS